MIISFAWTTPALLAGAKTVTRRDWKPNHAALFVEDMLVNAWDKSPRTGKGHKVATIRLTKSAYLQPTSDMTLNDLRCEGFLWLREHGQAEAVDRITASWMFSPQFLWVVEFELVDTTTMPRQGPSAQGRADAQHFSSSRGGHGS